MFAFGRDEEARLFIQAAIAEGLPDTTEANLRFAAEHPELTEPTDAA